MVLGAGTMTKTTSHLVCATNDTLILIQHRGKGNIKREALL